MKDDPSQFAEYDPASSSEAIGYKDLPEWLAAEQEAQRTREAEDRCKIGLAVLVVVLSGIMALSAIYNYAGAGA